MPGKDVLFFFPSPPRENPWNEVGLRYLLLAWMDGQSEFRYRHITLRIITIVVVQKSPHFRTVLFVAMTAISPFQLTFFKLHAIWTFIIALCMAINPLLEYIYLQGTEKFVLKMVREFFWPSWRHGCMNYILQVKWLKDGRWLAYRLFLKTM